MKMPIIQIQIIEGRKQEQIQNLIFDVTEVVAKNLDVDVGQVRVLVNEIPSSCWGVGGRSKESLKES
ncbi:TPA: 4-oxalocrotonate tautomerase [Bacillus cereus]|nr:MULTISPECIES: 4-oxalocrotonate tautomerase [Bacillus]MCU5055008.1 4-oxalocrotonate tautomerase [Bacillus cereus]MEC0076811.1 4-oxalocrotonate tautomerase [Bacillus anthracis]MEC0097863.1 4-oxalocrotonate tautomerase [Bacillus anthracis]